MYNKVVLEKLARYDEFAEYREECWVSDKVS